MESKNIILIGFMGSGKTTFGKWIEKNCAKKFIDTDEYIVLKEKRSINDIFATDGEEYFRNVETEVLKELIVNKTHNSVLSLGGGMPIREENGAILKALGTVVYLKADIDVLAKRLENDSTRPLLAGGDIKEKISKLMDERADIYERRADIIIDTDGLTFEQMYGIIDERLRQMNEWM